MSTVEHRFIIPEELQGQRLDRCLAILHETWTRSGVRRMIDQGQVTLNDQPARPSAIVKTGDLATVREEPPMESEVLAQDINLQIIYEDEHLIVVDKPAGLVIHPAAGNPDGTLVNALLHHCSDLSGIGGVERPGIVHRLDKDTTGLIVVAKSDVAHQGLSLAFRWRKVHKTYMAVCYGVPGADEGIIDQPIGRHPRERQMMAVRDSGRAARTLYTVEERLGGSAVVACRPISGRTHQIRVHMAHAGHALVGDPLYSGKQWKNLASGRAQKLCRNFPRQALHAWRLSVTHPVTGEVMDFEAPVPADLRDLIHGLRSLS